MYQIQQKTMPNFTTLQQQLAILEIRKILELALDAVQKVCLAFEVCGKVGDGFLGDVVMGVGIEKQRGRGVGGMGIRESVDKQVRTFKKNLERRIQKMSKQATILQKQKSPNCPLSPLSPQFPQFPQFPQCPKMPQILQKIKAESSPSPKVHPNTIIYKQDKNMMINEEENQSLSASDGDSGSDGSDGQGRKVNNGDGRKLEDDDQGLGLGLGGRLEERLSRWVVRRLQKGYTVGRHDLKIKAFSIRENSNFKASRTWMSSYFRRYPHIKKLILQCQQQHISDESQQHLPNPPQYPPPQPQSIPQSIHTYNNKKIIINKNIINEITESRYTPGHRPKISYVNGNGFQFKNVGRCRHDYWEDLVRRRDGGDGVVVKEQMEEMGREGKEGMGSFGGNGEECAKEENAIFRNDENPTTRKETRSQQSNQGSKLHRFLKLMKQQIHTWTKQ